MMVPGWGKEGSGEREEAHIISTHFSTHILEPRKKEYLSNSGVVTQIFVNGSANCLG